MSRSTNASKGTPGDDEGRPGEDRDELTDEVNDAGESERDEPLPDELADDETVADESAADESTDDQDDVEDEVSDAVEDGDAEAAPAAAAAKKRPAAARSTAPAKRPTGAKGAVAKKDKKQERRGPIAAIVLFVRQVIAELRKVVTPTTKELGTYSAVVIVFVLIVMAYVGVIDLAVGKLVLWAFGG